MPDARCIAWNEWFRKAQHMGPFLPAFSIKEIILSTEALRLFHSGSACTVVTLTRLDLTVRVTLLITLSKLLRLWLTIGWNHQDIRV